jgi:hypothetical protein
MATSFFARISYRPNGWAVAVTDQKSVQSLLDQIDEPLSAPSWGYHVTFVRREHIPLTHANYSTGKIVLVNVISSPYKTYGEWWCADVECQALNDIRTIMGLSPSPRVRLHITLGRARPYDARPPTTFSLA